MEPNEIAKRMGQTIMFSGTGSPLREVKESWWTKNLDVATNYADSRANGIGGGSKPLVLAALVDPEDGWEPDPDEYYDNPELKNFKNMSEPERSDLFQRAQNAFIQRPVEIIGVWQGQIGSPFSAQIGGEEAIQWLEDNWVRIK